LQKDSVQLSLKVFPNGFTGTLNNSADLTAKSPYGVFKVVSNDPTVGNGVAVRNPTKFFLPIIDIFIPSGFSPNHDGVNDAFVISHPYNMTINLEVFNRWGNLVFRSRDYKNEFDGRGNQPNNILGEELPDATYYYIVLATDKASGAVKKFAGFITLKRN
jgi:gliding motility-associated-like protein